MCHCERIIWATFNPRTKTEELGTNQMCPTSTDSILHQICSLGAQQKVDQTDNKTGFDSLKMCSFVITVNVYNMKNVYSHIF